MNGRFVYFAQHPDGRIKIGSSARPGRRCQALGCALLATVPGATGRETFFHCLFAEYVSPRGTEREWFGSALPIWRLIIEINDHGALEWLPDEIDGNHASSPTGKQVIAYFGSHDLAKQELGYYAIDWHRTGGSRWGRFTYARMRREGLIPQHYLSAAPSEARAA